MIVEEYPIFSNRLPSFEYSIWECVDNMDFATGIDTPSGMALGPDGERLFVAERGTGKIHVYEIASGARLFSIDTGFTSIGGMSFSPTKNILHFVDDETNTLNSVQPTTECTNPVPSRLNPDFADFVENAQQVLGASFSLLHDYSCVANPVIPDASFFDQVHDDTGYASDNPDVQSDMAGMDAAAASLANRTDCGYFSDLNFDALLLGGYFCHQCLPEQDLTCDFGGTCTNVQWSGYTCDNEFLITQVADQSGFQLQTANGIIVDPVSFVLKSGVTYRFTVLGDSEVCFANRCASRGPIIIPVEGTTIIPLTADGAALFTLSTEDPPAFYNLEPTSALTSNPSSGPTSSAPVPKPTEILKPIQPITDQPTSEPTGSNRDEPKTNSVTDVSSDDGSGLSGGALAGIIIAALLGTSIGVYAIVKMSKADNEVFSNTKSAQEQAPAEEQAPPA